VHPSPGPLTDVKENGIVKQLHTTSIQQRKKKTVALRPPKKTARARNTNRRDVEQMLTINKEVSIGLNRHAGTMPKVNITEAVACMTVDNLESRKVVLARDNLDPMNSSMSCGIWMMMSHTIAQRAAT